MTGTERVQVPLAHLTRAELERALLHVQGLNRSLLETIRLTTQPDWKVAREVARVVEKYGRRVEYLRAPAQLAAEAQGARAAADRIWSRIPAPTAPPEP